MPEDSRTAIAKRLRQAREAAGLTQGQVARKLDLHRPTVSEIEASRRRVTAEEVAALAELYGVSADWITSGQGDTDPSDDRLALVARQLGSMSESDIDRLMEILRMLRSPKGEK